MTTIEVPQQFVFKADAEEFCGYIEELLDDMEIPLNESSITPRLPIELGNVEDEFLHLVATNMRNATDEFDEMYYMPWEKIESPSSRVDKDSRFDISHDGYKAARKFTHLAGRESDSESQSAHLVYNNWRDTNLADREDQRIPNYTILTKGAEILRELWADTTDEQAYAVTFDVSPTQFTERPELILHPVIERVLSFRAKEGLRLTEVESIPEDVSDRISALEGIVMGMQGNPSHHNSTTSQTVTPDRVG